MTTVDDISTTPKMYCAPPPRRVLSAEEGLQNIKEAMIDSDLAGEATAPVFVKADHGKPRPDLLPPHALLAVSEVLAAGVVKYSANNWRLVDDRQRYYAALQRHALAYQTGENTDPESGLSTLAHLACNALFLLECELLRLGKDSRPTHKIISDLQQCLKTKGQ